MLCGIGFTMSLFIGELSFNDADLIDAAKMGTLLGSALSFFGAFVILRLTAKTERDVDRDEADEVFGENFDVEPTLDDPETTRPTR